MGAIFCYITLSPYLYMSVFGWSPPQYGCIGLTSAFGNITGFFFARRFAHRLGFHEGILIGSCGCFISSVLFIGICWLFYVNASVLVVYSIIFYFFSALSVVFASTGAMNLFPSMGGIASAMIGAAQIGAGVFGSVLASLLPPSPCVLGGAMGILSFSSFIIGIFLTSFNGRSGGI